MRAHWPYLQAYLVRGATCWIAAHAVVAIVAWFGGLPALPLTASGAVEMIAASVALGFVDTRRRREMALIGNLAIHPVALTGALATPAVLGELMLHVIGTGVR
ncbi:MAG TPA: hypothetical protein VGH04_16065 [Gemmatimonadaceae bacterium]